jgi:hypothetical protein
VTQLAVACAWLGEVADRVSQENRAQAAKAKRGG